VRKRKGKRKDNTVANVWCTRKRKRPRSAPLSALNNDTHDKEEKANGKCTSIGSAYLKQASGFIYSYNIKLIHRILKIPLA